MSKKVVTFLVVLLAVAAVVILLAKQSQKPDPSSTPAQQEASVTPAPDAATTETAKTEETKTEVAAAETKIESAAKPEETKTETGSSLLGDDNPETLSASEAKPEPKSEPKSEAEAKAAPVIVPVTPKEEKAPIVTGSDGSLLAPSASLEVDMDNALAERIIGDPDAPVTVIEYASMTCPHCARFHNEILEKVKAQLIDTGKLRLIFRDYPLDTHALRAAMMARCTDRSRYFNLVEVIFKNQDRWVKSSDPLAGLKQLGALAGMDSSFIEACIKNPELENHILSGMQDGQKKYNIKATPTFIFNNDAEQLSGDQDLEDFERVVNKLMKKAE